MSGRITVAAPTAKPTTGMPGQPGRDATCGIAKPHPDVSRIDQVHMHSDHSSSSMGRRTGSLVWVSLPLLAARTLLNRSGVSRMRAIHSSAGWGVRRGVREP
jgi:hypothetical protein